MNLYHVSSQVCSFQSYVIRFQRPLGIGSNPVYFHFEFLAPFSFLTAQQSPANEIKHNHSPVVIVDLDPQIGLIKQGLWVYIAAV